MSDTRDYRATVFLPRTDFPMKAGLPQKEPAILARWQAEGLYEQVRKARAGREKFILHDGPPYANGDIHVGHALNHVLKDMVVRTQTLLGKDAPYVPGWDCHGLPIEWKVEEEYRRKKRDKPVPSAVEGDEAALREFRAECRAYAAHWVDVQREQLQRLGIGGDWDRPYLTMDFASEATIVSELMKFAESGQLYRGAKPVMWSPVEKTALAEAEVEYEDIVSTQIDVAFEIVESPIPELVGAYAVVWTTTPWTIPVNQAIAYGPEVGYQLYAIDLLGEPERLQELATINPWQDLNVLIAPALKTEFETRLRRTIRDLGIDAVPRLNRETSAGQYGPLVKGAELAGTVACHPIANLIRRPGESRGPASFSDASQGSGAPDQVRGDALGEQIHPDSPLAEFFLRPRPFLPGDFVTTDQGTGLVHMAPDHGEDDFALCKEWADKLGTPALPLTPVFAVEADGRYRADWGWLGGSPLSVINLKLNAPDGPICTDLRAAGALLAAGKYEHSYPHSWRSKAKLIYRCTPQWFVPMDRELKETPPPPSAVPLPETSSGRIEVESSPSLLGEGDQPEAGGGVTLRQTALAALDATRFVPDKGRNRIGAMVAGRPDWVLSRQRAWGVPITLFVERRTGRYLVDLEVNQRIVAAVLGEGVDAWSDANAQRLLGDAYDAADYERVTDILDVWFDSGSTHAFVLESGRWPALRWPADLYLEGSDQHRGWFQSSLLEACATRGRAPYRAVLTHGFTMDTRGEKMSKSKGNTVSPLKVVEQYGADIVRLWALSVDYTEDHRIGEEILKGVADQYRKLRNTFRYLLGALDGFGEVERVGVEAMPELERYVLTLLARLDGTLRRAVAEFDFNTYVRALIDFCNEDLSAFFFDIRKDSLYCDAPSDPKRRAYRTVLDTLFHALVRYAAPVLVFTAEEVWGTRYPNGGSVHLLEWPEITPSRRPGASRSPASFSSAGEGSGAPDQVRGDELKRKWGTLRALRADVLEAIEPLRRDKVIGSGLEADVMVPNDAPGTELAELFITGSVTRGDALRVTKTAHRKCGRCWRHLPEVREDGGLCDRCASVLADMAPAA